MKKANLYLLVFVLFLSGLRVSYAQTPQDRDCGTMQHLSYQKSLDPGLEARMNSQENKLLAYIAQHETELINAKATVTIPVVVHIVYSTAAQNISDARVIEQLNVLNTDFAGLNANGSMYGFASTLKANCEVQFCLAQRTPTGAATTGIERKQTTVSSFGTNDAVKFAAQGGLNAWDPTKYLNIWVCNLGSSLLGYAQFPTSGINSTFGVVIQYSAFGVTGAASPFNLGGTASHEVGHCFNLYHIWGDDGSACTGTDNCGDTPNQAAANTGCPAYPHVTCSNTPTGDMFMNFMDYSNDVCYSNFTPGQKARMQALLISGGLLASLTTSNGCVPPTTGSCDPPTGQNTSSITTTTATLNWNAMAGAVSYDVQYRLVGAGSWTTASTTSNILAITGLTAASSYEWQVKTLCSGTSSSVFSASTNFNTLTTSTCTDIYENNASRTTAKAISVNTDIFALISSATDVDWFKFSNTSAQKKIKITLTNLVADYDVSLYKSNGSLISTSQNGGTTSESIVYNTSTVGTYYVKVYGYGGVFSTSACYTLRAAIQASNFKGDDVNIIDEMNTPETMVVYPNPAHGTVKLDYNSALDGRMQLIIREITGKTVMSKSLELNKGLNHQELDLSGFAKGLYFIELQGNGQVLQQKLILE